MKLNRKISIALVLVMLLAMTLAVIPASATDSDTVRVYFENNIKSSSSTVTCLSG